MGLVHPIAISCHVLWLIATLLHGQTAGNVGAVHGTEVLDTVNNHT